MLSNKEQERVKKLIKRFLRKEGRVGFQLRQLNELFRMGLQIATFAPLLQKQISVPAVFKVFLLLHRLIIQSSQEPEPMIGILSALLPSPSNQFDQLLIAKLLEPYRIYLQRRALVWTWEMGLTEKREKQVRVYQLLNLINLGASFADIIYTFGRYYMEDYTWAIDFNIVLGADLQGLYEHMVENVHRPASKTILDQIQAVHQKMYVVYYNCYFHKFLKNYIPKWVITDHINKRRARILSPQKERTARIDTSKLKSSFSTAKTKSTTPVRISQDNMGDSCLFLNEKIQESVENQQENDFRRVQDQKGCREQISRSDNAHQRKQQQRFKLLLSMQRVISTFKM